MAKPANIVGDIATTLAAFASDWVQTLSDYHVLMARSITHQWCSNHLPVLSQHGHDASRFTIYSSGTPSRKIPIVATPGDDDHVLYTGFSLAQPQGKVLRCPIFEHQGLHPKGTHNGVRITCQKCESKCTIPQFKTDRTTPLGSQGIVAIKYPQDQYIAQWELSKLALSLNSLRPTPTTPDDVIPPLPKEVIDRPQIHLSLPKVMTKSASLPSSRAISPHPSPTPLVIRIPPMKSTPNLLQPEPSGRSGSGTRSGTATPPPPSPQEQPESRKRTIDELASQIWNKRARSHGPR